MSKPPPPSASKGFWVIGHLSLVVVLVVWAQLMNGRAASLAGSPRSSGRRARAGAAPRCSGPGARRRGRRVGVGVAAAQSGPVSGGGPSVGRARWIASRARAPPPGAGSTRGGSQFSCMPPSAPAGRPVGRRVRWRRGSPWACPRLGTWDRRSSRSSSSHQPPRRRRPAAALVTPAADEGVAAPALAKPRVNEVASTATTWQFWVRCIQARRRRDSWRRRCRATAGRTSTRERRRRSARVPVRALALPPARRGFRARPRRVSSACGSAGCTAARRRAHLPE